MVIKQTLLQFPKSDINQFTSISIQYMMYRVSHWSTLILSCMLFTMKRPDFADVLKTVNCFFFRMLKFSCILQYFNIPIKFLSYLTGHHCVAPTAFSWNCINFYQTFLVCDSCLSTIRPYLFLTSREFDKFGAFNSRRPVYVGGIVWYWCCCWNSAIFHKMGGCKGVGPRPAICLRLQSVLLSWVMGVPTLLFEQLHIAHSKHHVRGLCGIPWTVTCKWRTFILLYHSVQPHTINSHFA
jgi:hypothetical protein